MSCCVCSTKQANQPDYWAKWQYSNACLRAVHTEYFWIIKKSWLGHPTDMAVCWPMNKSPKQSLRQLHRASSQSQTTRSFYDNALPDTRAVQWRIARLAQCRCHDDVIPSVIEDENITKPTYTLCFFFFSVSETFHAFSQDSYCLTSHLHWVSFMYRRVHC